MNTTTLSDVVSRGATDHPFLVLLVGVATGLMTCHIWNVTTTRKKKQRRSWPVVPGSLPIVGNFLEIGSALNMTKQFHAWADRYGQETGAFEIDLMGIRQIVVCREDLAVALLSKRPAKLIRSPPVREALNSVHAKGLFTAEGMDWKSDHRIVSPALNHKMVKEYFSKVKIVSDRLVEKWDRASAGGSQAVDINGDCYAQAMDITSLVIVGKDFDSLRSVRSANAMDVLELGRTSIGRMVSPIPYWKIPLIGQYLDGGGWAINRLYKRMNDIITEQEADEKKTDTSLFVGKIVDLNRRDSAKMSRERQIGNLLTMFVAGTDTSGTNLSTAIYLLGQDRELQGELATEAMEVMSSKDTLTVDELHEKLPRMRSFMYETMRVFSPVPFLFFKCLEDIPFMNTTLSRGTEVNVLLRYANMNPTSPPGGVKLGPKGEPASAYCPRRWLSEQRGKDDGIITATVESPSTKMAAFLPFGYGMRLCPGREFGETSFLYNLSNILSRFEFRLKDDHPPVERKFHSTDMLDGSVQVMFTPRG